jgi:5-methylcytosine-specific restriction endonuclease McrA
MKEFAERFYKSKAWQSCRKGYIKSVGGLCERCLSQGKIVPGVIVHHKIYITPDNIHCPEIVMDWGNLELLCRECHEKEHRGIEKRFRIDELGRVTAL